jgi:hypothetical protein
MDPVEMDPLDRTLESIVREWVASNAPDRATVRVNPAKPGGPPSIEVTPRNPAAIKTTLWVADDGGRIGFWIGGGSEWPDHVRLERESIGELLSAVAAARAGEEVRRARGQVIARNGYVQLAPDRRLTYRDNWILQFVPGLKWEQVVYQAY